MAEGGGGSEESTDPIIGLQHHFKGTLNNNDEPLSKESVHSPVASLQMQLNEETVNGVESDRSPQSSPTESVCVEEEGRGRRQSKSSSLPHGVKLCPEGPGPCIDPPGSPSEEKWVRLEEELKRAQKDLQAKDDEVEKLKGIRQLVEDELHDLTSSVFLEAHKMVSEAKSKELSSEKSLRETRMQLEGLQAEVAALKTLLITSTPARPNLPSNTLSLFSKKQHKRTPSHNHLLYGRDDTDTKERCPEKGVAIDRERSELDPMVHSLFTEWRESPSLVRRKSPFLEKIYREDVLPCLEFNNTALVNRLLPAVEENSVWVEPYPDKKKTQPTMECALLQTSRLCHYRMSFAFESEEWFDISQLARDRIAAVCEFLNYLRYMKNGLVKACVDESYWEVIRLRKQMAFAKLGLPIT